MSETGPLVYVVDDDVSAREGVARLIRSAGLFAKSPADRIRRATPSRADTSSSTT